MKILVVGNYFPEHFGGIEFVTSNLVKHYRSLGHQVRWVAADVSLTPHLCHKDDIPLKALNFTEEKLGFPYPIPLPSLRNFQSLRKQVHWCDVIHLHDCLYISNILVFSLSRRIGKPVLLTQHVKALPYKQIYKRTLQNIAYQVLGRWLLGSSEQVTFISQSVQGWFERFVRFKQNPMFIPNGVDIELFHPATEKERQILRDELNLPLQKPLFLFIGRFVEKKGIRLLRPIIEQNHDWHWVLIGRPDDEDPNTWLTPNITVLQPLPQQTLRKYYSAADLFVLPSVGEGFPLSVQESAACGTPALISDETAQSLPGIGKIFFSVLPQTDAVRKQLEDILLDKKKLYQMRTTVREYACIQWSWTRTSEQYLELLEDEFLYTTTKLSKFQ